MLAYDYPVMGIFWSMLIFFCWFIWLMLLFRVFADLFRNHEMSGWGKALWTIFVIFVPVLGVFVYLIAHGSSMAQRDVAAAQQNEADFQAYVRQAAGSGGTADELTKLSDLHAKGVLNDDEFAAQKAKLLA